MPTNLQISDVLKRLRSGERDAGFEAVLEQMSPEEFIAQIRESYPVLFQERHIGRKHEVGMAQAVRFEFSSHQPSDSLFPVVQLAPILWRCVFVSSYDNSISEVTVTKSIRARPAWRVANEAVLKLGSGFKLDKGPDGWTLKSVERRASILSNEFLRKRGWKFEVLQPLLAKRRA
jgi:hypothetical protein